MMSLKLYWLVLKYYFFYIQIFCDLINILLKEILLKKNLLTLVFEFSVFPLKVFL